jgi:hypothetical protein
VERPVKQRGQYVVSRFAHDDTIYRITIHRQAVCRP